MPYLFVYGSLKSTEPNVRWMDSSCKLIRKAKSLPYYVMYNLTFFPCIQKADPGYAIHGEIWQVSEEMIETLDIVEGHPYYREQIQLEDWDKPIEAYFFRYDWKMPKIESGLWTSNFAKSRKK